MPEIKAKRRLTDMDFSKEGAHVALVDKAANGHTVLITKAEKSTEDIKKEDIQVKMDIVDFFRVFFHMFTSEAATLAAILGFEQTFFDEDFTFEEFNSLGATEVTLLKAASSIDKTEESLSEFVNDLPTGDIDTLKAFAESFNTKLKDHNNMTEIQKALEAQKAEIEKAANEKIEKAQKEAEAVKAELAEINKAKDEARKVKYVELAKTIGAKEDFGVDMAVVAMTEQGLSVIKALEDAHKRLSELVEKETGFTGESTDAEPDTKIMKAMKNKFSKKEQS